jgi:hypothetical protein
MADRFLSEPRTSSGDLRYPIFIHCQESLRRNALNADAVVRTGQKRLAEPYFPTADTQDDALGLPTDQNTVVLLDGLDEVQLSEQQAEELFGDLLGRANARRRFVVFSRPAAVPRTVHSQRGVVVLELEEFTIGDDVPMLMLDGELELHEYTGDADATLDEQQSSQVGRWLARWAELAPAPHPTVADLTERKLLDLCRTPVLRQTSGAPISHTPACGVRSCTERDSMVQT